MIGVRRPMRKTRNAVSSTLLLLVTGVILLPVFLMLLDSVRSNADVASHPIGMPASFQWQNYVAVFNQMGYLNSLKNSVVVTASSVALVVGAGSAASWAIARYTRRWANAAYRLFIAGLTIPVFVLTTPLYLLVQELGLLDKLVAVILIYAAFHLPFAVFFYVSFLRSVPEELEQAAAVDGCGPFMTYWHVILPMLKPATATMSIFVALSIWNDVVIPLLFLSSDNTKTVTLSVYSFIGTQGGIQPSQLFPSVVLATVPLFVVFLILQRHIVAGIAAGIGK